MITLMIIHNNTMTHTDTKLLLARWRSVQNSVAHRPGYSHGPLYGRLNFLLSGPRTFIWETELCIWTFTIM